jgi:hypothetical protein
VEFLIKETIKVQIGIKANRSSSFFFPKATTRAGWNDATDERAKEMS